MAGNGKSPSRAQKLNEQSGIRCISGVKIKYIDYKPSQQVGTRKRTGSRVRRCKSKGQKSSKKSRQQIKRLHNGGLEAEVSAVSGEKALTPVLGEQSGMWPFCMASTGSSGGKGMESNDRVTLFGILLKDTHDPFAGPDEGPNFKPVISHLCHIRIWGTLTGNSH